MIELNQATLIYKDHNRDVFACREASFSVGETEFLGILGPSGSGKSSLLYLLSGLKDPTSGSAVYRGTNYRELNESKRAKLRLNEFGFVFQQPYLLGYLSALENVILTNAGNGAVSRGAALLADLGLADKAHRLPSELSGGEKQRVCVARALFMRPKVIFADEPTASLDHATGQGVIETLNTGRARALIVVTHDPTMLADADRIIEIESGTPVELSSEQKDLLRAHLSK